MTYAAISQTAIPRFGRFWNPTVFLCIAGVMLPNALSLGALAAGIGSPPRTGAIIAYATLAVIARVVSAPVTVVLYIAAVGYEAVAAFALLVNPAPSQVMVAVLRLAVLQPVGAPV